MSGLFGAAQPVNLVRADDRRIFPAQYRADMELSRIGEDVANIASYANAYWPASGFAGENGSAVAILDCTMWAPYDDTFGSGAASRFGMVGVTRDVFGTPVAAVTVKLYRTSDDILLDSTTSDPDGNFLLNTPYYPDAHYIVAHKTGTPDVDGVTTNTLVGS